MSGRKNVLQPLLIVGAGDMSGDLSSVVLDARWQDNIGLQVQWTGAPSGVVQVEASINYNSVNGDGDFHALTFDPELEQPVSSSGGYLINLNQLPFAYYKVTYSFISGTGELNVYACSKEV